MTRKTKRIMARILAVVMAATLVPSNMWGTAGVVMAEETAKVMAEEESDVTVETVQETQEEADEKENVIPDKETETFVPDDADEAVEAERKAETREEKKETEKVSVETDNKAVTGYVHNFTTDGLANDSFFTIINGNLQGKPTQFSYTDKSGTELELKAALKMESKTTISFETKQKGTLILVHPPTFSGSTKVDDVKKAATGGIIEVTLEAGSHTVTKGDTTDLYYIAFIPEGAEKPSVAEPTASPTTDTELKVGDTITLSCTTDDATIYYTTDGKEPKDDESKEIYSNGICVTVDMVREGKVTIKAYASMTDYTDSETVSFTYNVSMEAGENQLKMPTAEPDPTEGAVSKGTKITLKSDEPDVKIYYTTDGSAPSIDSELFDEANPIEITQEMTIKAIATAVGKDDSFPATFEYTIKKPTIAVDASSTALISSVALDGDVTFTNGTDEVFDIKLKAQENTSPADAIKEKAESLKEDGTIVYYDFSLINAENVSDTVKIEETSTGSLEIKLPYATGAGKRNDIIVLNGTDEIVIEKANDGFSFYTDSFKTDSVSVFTVITKPVSTTVGEITITECAGYEEGAYAEWEAVEGADGYMAYVAKAGGEFERIDDELIREYKDYWRVDTVGLAKGSYYIKIDAVALETKGVETTATVIATNITDKLNVTNYDRSGFAFSSDSRFGTGSGAYNDDGTLKENAQVIYVTAETAKTCKALLHTAGANKPAVEYEGLQTIIDNKNKGDSTKDDILDIRIIGCITKDDLDHISSSAIGFQIKGKNAYSEMNITVEGIGEDAAVHGFGFLLRNCGNVELRNFALMAFMEDGVSLDTENCNIWVHDLDIFYGATGGDSDQAKGDGSLDLKDNTQHCTFSYNHFWDSGKSSLCGMKSESGPNYITYHHNWFDHSDSRHPRIRTMSVHVYNNYYDGNSKYGVGVTMGSSAFVEANYFRNCKYPMLSSKQGTDATGDGTFSGESGGMIKAYNNTILGAQRLVYANAPFGSAAADSTQFDAYLVSNRSDTVPNTCKTVSGGTSYDNFDTIKDLGVKEADIDTPENVPTVVMAKAGRLNGGDFKWEFNNATEDTNDGVISELKTAVVYYKTSVKKIGSGVAKDVIVIEDADSNAPGEDNQVVDPPTANEPSGEVEKGTEITLSGDGQIYYTLTGLDPTTESSLYTAPIVINKETTIKAIAVVGTSESRVVTFKYTIPGGTTPTPPPSSGGDDDDKPAQGTYTLEIKDAYEAAVSGATTNREEKKGTNDFFTLLFVGKTSGGSAISEKSSELEFKDGYKSNRFFLTSGAAKTNQASVKIVTKDKTTVTVWWQPGGTTDLQKRQLTVLNASGNAVYTSNISNLDTNVGYVTPIELDNAGTYYIGSATSSINIYKIEVKYPENEPGPNPSEPGPNPSEPGPSPSEPGPNPSEPESNPATNPSEPGSEPGPSPSEPESNPDQEALYKIHYDANGGVLPSGLTDVQKKAGEKVTIPAACTKVGYTFKGWSIDETNVLTGEYTVKAEDAVNGVITITALYDAKTYTILYDANGGTLPEGAPETVTAKTGDLITLPECTPASGKQFIGWQLGSSDTIIEESYIVHAENADNENKIVLKAVYADEGEIYYTVTIDTDGGKLIDGGEHRVVKAETSIDLGACEKEGFEFKGWTVEGEDVTMPYTVTKDVTFKAKYTQSSGKSGIYIEGLKDTYEYTGDKITPAFDVINYDISGGTVLTLGVDYTVTYKDNKEPGKATVIVKGKGNYASEKNNEASETFTIAKPEEIAGNKIDEAKLISVKGAKVTTEKSLSYDGTPKYPNIELAFKGADAQTYKYKYDTQNKKYVRDGGGDMNVYISVSNNVNKGNATILVTGAQDKGKETKVKAKFKIAAVKLDSANTTISDANKTGTISAVYSPQGAVPAEALAVTYKDEKGTRALTFGKDYIVKYSGNKKTGTAVGTVTVTGKGGYTGKATAKFDITPAPMTDFKVAGVAAHDGIKTVGKIKATVVHKKDGSELKAKQYQLEYYKSATGSEKYDPSEPLKGSEIKELWVAAVAVDTDNLKGTETETERMKVTVGTDISKAKFKIKKGFSMPYTGNPVTLTDAEGKYVDIFESVTIKVNGETKTLDRGTHYEIVSYSNNINKGNATAVIAGKGEAYSGTKTIKFKIGQQPIKKDTTKFEFNTLFNQMNGLLGGLFH